MRTHTTTFPIEPGDCVYVRGCYHVFLVLDVHQGKALICGSDVWVKHKWVPVDACRPADDTDR
jgi:hypothetical protein